MDIPVHEPQSLLACFSGVRGKRVRLTRGVRDAGMGFREGLAMVEAGLEDAMRRLDQRKGADDDDDAPLREANAPLRDDNAPLRKANAPLRKAEATRERKIVAIPVGARRGGTGGGGMCVGAGLGPMPKAGGGRVASWRAALHAAATVQRIWRGHVGRVEARKALEVAAGEWLQEWGEAVSRHGNVGKVRSSSLPSLGDGFGNQG